MEPSHSLPRLTAQTIFQRCIVEYGGAGVDAQLIVYQSSPSIRDCTVSHSDGNGILVAERPIEVSADLTLNPGVILRFQNGTGLSARDASLRAVAALTTRFPWARGARADECFGTMLIAEPLAGRHTCHQRGFGRS